MAFFKNLFGNKVSKAFQNLLIVDVIKNIKWETIGGIPNEIVRINTILEGYVVHFSYAKRIDYKDFTFCVLTTQNGINTKGVFFAIELDRYDEEKRKIIVLQVVNLESGLSLLMDIHKAEKRRSDKVIRAIYDPNVRIKESDNVSKLLVECFDCAYNYYKHYLEGNSIINKGRNYISETIRSEKRFKKLNADAQKRNKKAQEKASKPKPSPYNNLSDKSYSEIKINYKNNK